MVQPFGPVQREGRGGPLREERQQGDYESKRRRGRKISYHRRRKSGLEDHPEHRKPRGFHRTGKKHGQDSKILPRGKLRSGSTSGRRHPTTRQTGRAIV